MTTNHNTAAAPSFADALPHFRLGQYDRICIDGNERTIHSKTACGYVLKQMSHPWANEEFTFEDLDRLYKEGRLDVTANHYSSVNALRRLQNPSSVITELSPERQDDWAAALRMVETFLKKEAEGLYRRSDAHLLRFVRDYAAQLAEEDKTRTGTVINLGKGYSPTALRKKITRFENNNYDPLVLVDGYGRSGNRDNRIVGAARELMEEVAAEYASNLKPTKARLYRKMVRLFAERLSGTPVPSRDAFSRAVDKLDLFHVMAAREGEVKAQKLLYAVRQNLLVTRPLERVEMDECLMPLQAMLQDANLWETLPLAIREGIKASRWWYSKAIDSATKVVLGFVVSSSPTTASALATVRMILEDKTELARALGCETSWSMFGLPEMIVTDNGKPYIAAGFREACLNLGITHVLTPAGMPQMRGGVERSFGTDHQEFFSNFGGRTFCNIIEKGNYDPLANTSAAIEEVARLAVRYWVDIYHNKPHAGLCGETPLTAWKKGMQRFGVIPPPNKDYIRHVLGTPVQAPVRNEGVEVLGLHYQSLELQNSRRRAGNKRVLVRVDVTDIGHISVRIDTGWIVVPCTIDGFDGKPLSAWETVQANLRRTNASVAKLSEDVVHRAMKDIDEAIDRTREAAGIPTPLMTPERLVAFDKKLALGFGMTRAKNGPASILTDDAALEPLAKDSQRGLTAVKQDFFTE